MKFLGRKAIWIGFSQRTTQSQQFSVGTIHIAGDDLFVLIDHGGHVATCIYMIIRNERVNTAIQRKILSYKKNYPQKWLFFMKAVNLHFKYNNKPSFYAY